MCKAVIWYQTNTKQIACSYTYAYTVHLFANCNWSRLIS